MLPSWVDEEMPFTGPCLICCSDDARHRVADAIVERVNAGEWVEDVARDFGVSDKFVGRLVGEALRDAPTHEGGSE